MEDKEKKTKKDSLVNDIDEKEKKVRTTRKKKIEEVAEIKNEIEIREVIVERKAGFNYAEVIVIMIITLILGTVIGSFVSVISSGKGNVGQIVTEIPSDLKEFVNTYNNILNDYYEEVDREQLLEAGINGMLEYLDDDYSVYMDQDTSSDFNEQVEGKYTGIGVEIIQEADGRVYISRVFDNSPAAKVGLQAGDVFVSVDGVSVKDKSASDISSLIKGSTKNEIKVIIKRGDVEKSFDLSLKVVEIDSVNSKVFERNGKKIGYLELTIFASNTYTQFEKKLLELEGKNIDSLVIDVRDNSGGYLSTVTDIASLFMNKSKIIYQLDTKGVVEQIYSRTNTSRDYDIVVLINQNSASASEILAGALQESYGATVVGTNSYGKGTVQKAYQLESGAIVKYTIQKWLTPDGNWINEKGITPDVEVSLDGDYFKNPSDEADNQLQKALEVLAK